MKNKNYIYNLTCQQEAYGLSRQMPEQNSIVNNLTCQQDAYGVAREDINRGQKELREINRKLFLEKFNGKFIGL